MKRLREALVVLAAVACFVTTSQGQDRRSQPDVAAFRYERPILVGTAGPQRLDIDVPVLAGAQPAVRVSVSGGEHRIAVATNGLGDLRIYDSAGREVPYLLVPPPVPEETWATGRILPVVPRKKSSGFEIDLGKPRAINRVRLEGLPAPFMKRVQLEASGDRSHWTLLVTNGTLFDLPDDQLRLVDLGFEAGDYRYLRVAWDDTTSGRMPLPPVAAVRLTSDHPLPPPLRIDVAFERRSSEPGRSRYRLRLPAAQLPIVAIELALPERHVLRPARVMEARLSGSHVEPTSVGAATLRRTVRGDLAASQLRIAINPTVEAELDLIIDDGDNPPLAISGVMTELAHLPWIFFETDGKLPLVARYGHPKLERPRYDLEAARDGVDRVQPAAARWGEPRGGRPVEQIPTGLGLPATGAAIDAGAFRFRRPIPGGRFGLTALRLDAAALAHSRGGTFVDLRIVDASCRQVPYLLERLDEPLSVDLPPLEKTAAPPRARRDRSAASVYRVRLPYPELPAGRLVLTTPARVFERWVFLEVERISRDRRGQDRTEQVASGGWRHVDAETAAPPLVLSVASLGVRDAVLSIDEGDNSPLPLGRPRLLLPAWRLRFFRETGAPLTLLYGRDDLAAPRYDLALLAPQLVGAAAHEVWPGPELAAPGPAVPVPNIIFWSVLAAGVAVLLLLIVRLVAKGQPPIGDAGT